MGLGGEDKEEIIALPPYDAAAKKNEKANKGIDAKANKEAAEEAARHAQYISIKQLYETLFRAWLANLDADRLNAYIDKAVPRATKDAQKNGKDEAAKACITARAANLPRPIKGEKIDRFFFNLMAETATEMRVQKDYKSDGEQAKEQAKYIENLKCDIIALALADYLQADHEISTGEDKKKVKFSYLVLKEREKEGHLLESAKEPKFTWGNQFEDTLILGEDKDISFKPWLFFLLHLMPVEEAAALRQQIRKWQIIVGKTENADKEAADKRIEAAKVRPLLQVFDLYIALHDEQFNTGEEQLQLSDDDKKQFRRYYACGFNSVFDEQIQQSKDGKKMLQAIRGLLEMRRFGNEALDTIFHEKEHKVSKDSASVWKAESDKDSTDYQKVAVAQKERKELHAEWVKAKGKVNKDWWHQDKQDKKKYYLGKKSKQYSKDLKTITRHRYAVAQVELQNHLHKLLMAVLGRLVDFSGLFERDLYFTMPALFNKVADTEDEFADN